MRNRGLAALLVLPALAGCDAQEVQAVGTAGDAYRSGQGCTPASLEVPGACPSGAQLGFDKLGDDAAFAITEGNLSGKQVSCRRTFCGTGSLVMHAEYAWREGVDPAGGNKLGEIHHKLPATTELFGRKLTYKLFLDGPTTPVNAYIAVIDVAGRFRMISDLPVYTFRDWVLRGGTVDAANTDLRLPVGTTSLLADEIVIAVYLATAVKGGDGEHWSADLYIDEIGW
jgi:hypothetical protein